MAMLANRSVRHAGLFTFPHSLKHIGLYQKFGFVPRFLTALLAKPVGQVEAHPAVLRYSAVSAAQQMELLEGCGEVTSGLYHGLAVDRDIHAVVEQGLGEVLLVVGDRLTAFAICHCGPGTEAGADVCYVKFAAVRPGADEARTFMDLLAACEAFAAQRGLRTLEAGINMGCAHAYQQLLQAGFHMEQLGVAMHRPNEPGYHRPGIYVIDDWR